MGDIVWVFELLKDKSETVITFVLNAEQVTNQMQGGKPFEHVLTFMY